MRLFTWAHVKALNPEEVQKDVALEGATLPRALVLEKHIGYLQQWGRDEGDYEYAMSEYLRMSGLYWVRTALDLAHAADSMGLTRARILEFVRACWSENLGGFGANPGHDPHILYTLSAVQILVSFDALDPALVEPTVKFIQQLQLSNGSFQGDCWGEIDTRFSFCSLACLALLGRLQAVRVEQAADFILQCMNFDGGFGVRPGSETHAGQVYCCVGALAIAGWSFLQKCQFSAT